MSLDTSPMIHYVIEFQYAGVDVRLFLNDVEIFHGNAEDKIVVQQKVNGWLLPKNELRIDAGFLDKSRARVPLDLKCLVFRGPHGRQPEESEALVKFEETDAGKLPTGSMSTVWRSSFAAEPYYGPWLWNSGEPIANDSVTQNAALTLVKSVAIALTSHDYPELMRRFRIYIDENARAFGKNPARLEDQLRMWGESWPQVAVPDPQNADYRFADMPNGRLLRISRADNQPVFTVAPSLPAVGVAEIFLARLHGNLTLVR